MAFLNGSYPLLSAASTTGAPVDWPGGRGALWATGNFGGATARLEWMPDGVNWLPVDRSTDTFTTFTAAGSGLFELPASKIRISITGGSGTSISSGASSL